jgi:FkbM family methyltransferase
MNKLLQDGLIGIYRLVKSTGVLETASGRRVFEASYRLYKERLEAGPIRMLRPWVRPNTFVIDVGANIGVFTRQFATWVSDGGKVVAIEAEAINYARLQKAVAKTGLASVVETVHAAVAETTGNGFLELNPGHPGDHKLGTNGVPVVLTTIDDLLAARGWPEVSLIKIDVQGAEARVIAGAHQTLQRFRPALFLEVADEQLRHFGSSARDLLATTARLGYTIHTLDGKGLSPPLSPDRAPETNGYEDMLLLPILPQHGASEQRNSRQSPL